ncbi:3',5'-cyclic adenosine monophosphate phosphodiesterase CpdA [Erythrobacter dokdonensis DSW-74]|uniref:3',5'-cyclic adenosine monophosphate phosphodiesterase CpdA n=2 Tax=Erythrobacter TaxID=1041 RepID=A0A1A7BC00_9SPHN|nr:3',5'-cyclic adenosine monophosphate phosphodiesterase CpdA [Erythrobacter dokdonensis DSW-74]
MDRVAPSTGHAALIAQMTDIHVGFAPDERPEELNLTRFRATLARLLAGPNHPDMLVLSGDITDHGDAESFAKTADLLRDVPFPIVPLVGNHDSREGLLGAFPQVVPAEGGFLHYVIEAPLGLRVICLDTLEDGRHGGAFCETRSLWLADRLAEAPDTPTLIFMHHPPVVAGIDWMDPAPGEPWMERLREVLTGQSQVQAIHCGHLHRQIVTQFAGIPLGVTPSVAPLVAMDLTPIDKDVPDDRELITTEPPTYALHRWDGERLVSHYERVGDWQVLARFHAGLQPMIEGMFAERE